MALFLHKRVHVHKVNEYYRFSDILFVFRRHLICLTWSWVIRCFYQIMNFIQIELAYIVWTIFHQYQISGSRWINICSFIRLVRRTSFINACHAILLNWWCLTTIVPLLIWSAKSSFCMNETGSLGGHLAVESHMIVTVGVRSSRVSNTFCRYCDFNFGCTTKYSLNYGYSIGFSPLPNICWSLLCRNSNS